MRTSAYEKRATGILLQKFFTKILLRQLYLCGMNQSQVVLRGVAKGGQGGAVAPPISSGMKSFPNIEGPDFRIFRS